MKVWNHTSSLLKKPSVAFSTSLVGKRGLPTAPIFNGLRHRKCWHLLVPLAACRKSRLFQHAASRAAALALLAGGLAAPAYADDTAATAPAVDRGDRIERRLDRRGDRIDARLDRRGDRVDRRLDRRAEAAAAAGHERAADRLDRNGDRVDRRLDRRGDRLDRQLDRAGQRADRRSDRRDDRRGRR